ncbi:MAG: transketolase [Chloroflexi bacterium]|nr:transketolase [Chloroflexota bacterium]
MSSNSHLKLTADTVRTLSMDAIQKANSGHPGMPMGMADTAVLLWSQYLKFDPSRPEWADRDRFVLSAGHGSMLLYSLLHLSGYDVSMDDLKDFRQWGSKTPGHPEYGHTPGVETTTGPLGQGISTAVGMALAERWLAARFNKPDYEVVNHRTFVIVGDGDLMEGVSSEASSLAGHWGLGKLIVLYDDNSISIDGSTDISFTEDALKRYDSYGWQTSRVDGHDAAAVAAALDEALADEERPSLIACRTVIGYGSPNKAGTSGVHGSPLGDAEIKLTKEKLGWKHEPFYVPDEARQLLVGAGQNGAGKHIDWKNLMADYAAAHPELAADFERAMTGELPENWDATMPEFDGKPLASRAASGKTLAAIIGNNPDMLGGSADLTGSNKTNFPGATDIQKDNYGGSYIRYGVREHGMGSIMNGLAVHGGVIPYGGTFLVFADYMRGAMRLAALMERRVIYVFTHDSIGLGEDGPTHQPVEQLASLRVIPNLVTLRPADAWETAVSWKIALQRKNGPTALILTRQGLPELDKENAKNTAKGAYVVADAGVADGDAPQAILIGTGSEVHIAMGAQKLLAEKGVASRVVSMPSWELFDAMPQDYKDAVLPPAITARVAIEAASPMGWERYVGSGGAIIGINGFGASAPFETIYREFGLTAEAVAEAAMRIMNNEL